MKLFDNRVLRGIFGRKRVEMVRDWRKMRNEGLHNLHSSPKKIRMMRWAAHVACMWAKRNAYRMFIGKPEGNRPLGSRRYMCKE
jgi:hypothetical protein